MKTIWKFPFQITDHQVIEMPAFSQLLTVQMQHGEPCLWALVNPDARKVDRHIIVHGTGHQVESEAEAYVGTVQVHGGQLIFHVFDGGETT